MSTSSTVTRVHTLAASLLDHSRPKALQPILRLLQRLLATMERDGDEMFDEDSGNSQDSDFAEEDPKIKVGKKDKATPPQTKQG